MAKRKATQVKKRLTAWFNQHGWAQSPPDQRLRKEFSRTYKRGYEVRLSALPEELDELLSLLQRADFKPGTPFPKANRLVVPLYGREQAWRFLELVGEKAVAKKMVRNKITRKKTAQKKTAQKKTARKKTARKKTTQKKMARKKTTAKKTG